jgi:polyisoprenoid-binding protein YceI
MSGVALLALAVLVGAVRLVHADLVWEIDPARTEVRFSVRHLMVRRVAGGFRTSSGSVQTEPRDVTRSLVEATIDARSIDTDDDARDEHLRSPDFLDVERYPTITFRSTRIERAGSGRWKVVGNLTLHGTTREVVLDVAGPSDDVHEGTRGRAHATTTLKRSEFGIAQRRSLDGGGALIGDEVAVTIDVEAVKR